MGEQLVATWDAMVGERIRVRREARGWLQEQLAHEMTGVGFSWQRSTVAAVERGHRRVAALELVAVAGVMGRSLTRFLGPDEGEKGVMIRGEVWAPADVVVELGDTVPVHWTLAGIVGTIDGERPEWTQSGGPRRLPVAESEADVKAARALGIEVAELRALAAQTWGRSLEREREARVDVEGVSARTVQARRGHVTRRLLDELRVARGQG